MSRSCKHFIWATIIVLAGATAVRLSHAQGGGSSPLILLPDLQVQSISVPTTVKRGEVISVSDTTTNTGTASAVLSVSAIYICTNLNNVSSSCLVTNHDVAGIYINSSTTWGPISVTVPTTTALGTNYYIVVANCNRQVGELNYYNNTNHVMIMVY